MLPFRKPVRPSRLSLRLLLALGGLGAAAGAPLAAGATTTYCRTDPTVTLSNGVAVQMWATINNASLSQVQSVNYVLHVPKGVSMTGITYDSSGYLEHVQVVADQSGTHYASSTTVYLTSGSTTMSANAVRRDSTVASKNGTTGTAVSLAWCT